MYSYKAVQSVAMSCNGQPMRMYGWNGQVISIENYKENTKDYSLEMELGCMVRTFFFYPNVNLFLII